VTITGIFGAIGSGKSWLQLQYAIRQCEKKKRRLVSNFFLNLDGIYDYCCWNNYKWFIENNLDNEGIIYINSNTSLASLLSIPRSVICLDEAGVFLNSRQFQSTPKELLSDLCQSRKMGADLIYAAQFTKQVDAQIRMLTQYVFHCKGTTVYNSKADRPELMMKNFHLFDAETYDQWIVSRHRNNPLKTRFAFAMESHTGPLTVSDSELFRCFDSLGRLDRQNPDKLNFKHGKYEPVVHRYLKVVNFQADEHQEIRTWNPEDEKADSGKMDEPTPLKDAEEEDKLSSESEQQLGVGLFSNIPVKPKAGAKKKAEPESNQFEWEECTILISSGNYSKNIAAWSKSWGIQLVQKLKILPADSKEGLFRLAGNLAKIQQKINAYAAKKNPNPNPDPELEPFPSSWKTASQGDTDVVSKSPASRDRDRDRFSTRVFKNLCLCVYGCRSYLLDSLSRTSRRANCGEDGVADIPLSDLPRV